MKKRIDVFLFGCAVLVTAFLVSGCGDDDVYVWGDTCSQISTSYCETAEHCWEDEIPGCVQHNVFHCCVLSNSCEHEESSEVEENANACSAALESLQKTPPREGACNALLFGIFPSACWPHLEDWQRER
jgi:hypothetical protein